MGLFKKKPGGTLLGNLLRAGASKALPGVLGTGANKVELGQTMSNKQLAFVDTSNSSMGVKTTFAGQPATNQNGTIVMTNPLQPVTVTPFSGDTVPQALGKLIEPIVSNATKGMNVGADNKTLWIIGGSLGVIGLLLALTLLKNR